MNDRSHAPKTRPTTQVADGVPRMRWWSETLVPLLAAPLAIKLAELDLE